MKPLISLLMLTVMALVGCTRREPAHETIAPFEANIAYEVNAADEPGSEFETKCVQDKNGNWACGSKKRSAKAKSIVSRPHRK